MIIADHSPKRELTTETIDADLVVVGGGLGGTCAAIAAAREGLNVVLVQDRPILGGNASSEVRLWILGATSHLGNNNRWSREGGVMNEIMEENLYRNRHGNALILDTILMEKCIELPNLRLLLNTAAHEVEKSDDETISSVIAFCSQNSTRYVLNAPYFCDASGDGIVGFLSGAAFRMGAESKDEFGEGFAPDEEYGELLGHSLYFYSKDVGIPVPYKAPKWALKDITKIPRYRQFNTNMQGCNFWWLEYGGRLDTIHQTEEIKWELWKVVYGVWDYIKNSGKFPEAETMTLEWVGHVPGKRESRRFEGDYIMRQQDVVEQTHFDDVVCHGGWAVDLHPADGVYSDKPGCTQWHSKGVYGIPYRSHYSRNIKNLFLAGRIISASHVAFGSTRVMATCGAGGQAVGVAAALCKEQGCQPADLLNGGHMKTLQSRLQRIGQYLPGISHNDADDLAEKAKVTASSTLSLSSLPTSDEFVQLKDSFAMLLPLTAGAVPDVTYTLKAEKSTTLKAQLRRCAKSASFTPDVILSEIEIDISAGTHDVALTFPIELEDDRYTYVCLMENEALEVTISDSRLTGILSVSTAFNHRVATSCLQDPPEGIGIDRFEFWLPQRRPKGQNLAFSLSSPIEVFGAENTTFGPARPTDMTNAWIADFDDTSPSIEFTWEAPVSIKTVIIELDPDWDHPLESVLMTHPEEVVPFVLREFEIRDDSGTVIHTVEDNHSARVELTLDENISTKSLSIHCKRNPHSPVSIFRVRCLS